MMTFMETLLCAACICWVVGLTARVVRGGVRMLRDEEHRTAVMTVDTTTGNPLAERGISLLVCGFDRLDDVARLLSADYLFYEVVVICDAGRNEQFELLLSRYSMMRVEYLPSERDRCGSVRAVYRSRERRYKRLVAVDHYGTDPAEMLNCGLAVASYDHVIPLSAREELYPEALLLFNSALGEADVAPDEDVTVEGVVESLTGSGPFAAVGNAVNNAKRAAGWGGHGNDHYRLRMLRRDGVAAAGGFVMRGRRAVCGGDYCGRLVHTAGSVACVRGGEHDWGDVWRKVAGRLFWSVWGVVTLWAFLAEGTEAGERMLLLPFVLYLATAAAGAVGTATASDGDTVAEQLRYRALLTLLLYPLRAFLRLWQPGRR